MHKGTVPVRKLAEDPKIHRMKGNSGYKGGLKQACLNMTDCLISIDDAMDLV